MEQWLTNFLNDRGFHNFEGNITSSDLKMNKIVEICRGYQVNHIFEIGFNAGHSATIFLSSFPNANLLSFDIGEHSYIPTSKEWIDCMFANRHTLVLGDSTQTVPAYDNQNVLYDVIFIDGGHDYEIAIQDLRNCRRFAHPNTLLILDDTIYRKDWECAWTIGPTKAWEECKNSNFVRQLGTLDAQYGGMSWGQYVF
jgi:predicted O-methyltransferase YrrM